LDTAVSIRVIERMPTAHAARFAFALAKQRGKNVCSTSKYTIQKATDGLFEETVGAVASKHPDVPYRRELFDALLAGIIMSPERYGVIVCANEYGDFLSDSACGLIGSIGLGDSASFSFNDAGEVTTAMFDPSGGTAPDIAGRNLANPTAALLAMGNMLTHIGEAEAGMGLRQAVLDSIAEGSRTRDIGGTLSTTEFTEHVANKLKARVGSA
jgi:isocitrate/isopropylmalate dehydrogenase